MQGQCYFDKERILEEIKATQWYSHSFNNPLIRSFLDDYDHLCALQNYIISPTQKNKNALDKIFQEFYTRIMITNYLSKTLYWASVNFDKKVRSSKKRFLPIPYGAQVEDHNPSKYLSSENNVEAEVLDAYNLPLDKKIENSSLREGFNKLTKRQKEVLQHIYGYKKSTNETSLELKITQQGVSKHHKSAITRLRKEMLSGKEKEKVHDKLD